LRLRVILLVLAISSLILVSFMLPSPCCCVPSPRQRGVGATIRAQFHGALAGHRQLEGPADLSPSGEPAEPEPSQSRTSARRDGSSVSCTAVIRRQAGSARQELQRAGAWWCRDLSSPCRACPTDGRHPALFRATRGDAAPPRASALLWPVTAVPLAGPDGDEDRDTTRRCSLKLLRALPA